MAAYRIENFVFGSGILQQLLENIRLPFTALQVDTQSIKFFARGRLRRISQETMQPRTDIPRHPQPVMPYSVRVPHFGQ